MSQNAAKKINSKQLVISEANVGQRIDNFLLRYFNKIPKSRVYQMLRKGEVRVNSGRIKQTYKLEIGDKVRIPPIYVDEHGLPTPPRALQQKIAESIIFENEGLIIINKPSGVVVHSGSSQSYGVIEAFRAIGKEYEKLELVHRLDKDTSGCLILAKSIPILRKLHETIKSGDISKNYMALLAGRLNDKKFTIDSPLSKSPGKPGEQVVSIDQNGKSAMTVYHRKNVFKSSTLVDIELITGRTHQIRVHSASIGHPVIGDLKYGQRQINQEYKKKGLRRMFLHAKTLKFKSPVDQKQIIVDAPLENDLLRVIENLANET